MFAEDDVIHMRLDRQALIFLVTVEDGWSRMAFYVDFHGHKVLT